MRSPRETRSVRRGLSGSEPHGMVPSVTAPRRRATYADLLEVPEHLVAEIIDGELLTSPRPASPHALAASAIGSALVDRFNGPPGGADAPGGWWILDEPELHLGDDVVVPDLAGWRRERMPVLPDVVGFTLAPDWVCEVISPSTARIDRGRKLRVYAREQVAHLSSSTSATTTSSARSSSARRRCPWWSTSGHRGARPAARSARCSSASRTSMPAPSCSPG